MIEMVQKLLADQGPELIRSLVEKAGFDSAEAQSFLPAAAEKVVAVLQGGDLDLGALLGGGGGDLLSKLNAGELASETGIGEAKVEAGLGELVPGLLSAFKDQSGGADALLAALGGGKGDGLLGAAGGLAGKLFK